MRAELILLMLLISSSVSFSQIHEKKSKITGRSFYYSEPLKLYPSGTGNSTLVVFTKGLIDSAIRMNISIKDQWVSPDAILNILYSDNSRAEIKVDSVISENALFPQQEGVFIGSYIISEIKEIEAFKISDPMFKFSRAVFPPSGKKKQMWKNLQMIANK